jgi:hypothetical protein
VTKPAVQKAVSTGRITLIDGKVDPEAADRQWNERTNQKQQRQKPIEHKPESKPKEKNGETFNEAQTRKEIALANLRELEEAEKRRSLLSAEVVRDAVNGMVMGARSKLLVIGDELADKMAATSDPVKCRELMDERINQALSELAEYPADAA